MKSLITTILFLFVSLGFAVAQNNISLLEKSTMKIEGTSNVHDWEAEVEEINIDMNFDSSALESESPSNPVESLLLNVPVEEMKSGKGGLDRRMHDALKEDDHPNITFELSSAKMAEGSSENSFQLTVSGALIVAGVEREVSFPVEGTVTEEGNYRFTGSYEVNMEDYDVDPPSAMFGAVRSGEMVTISFELFFEEG